MKKLTSGIPEKLIAHIWQRQMVTGLVTDTGKQLRVIYPGRVCNDHGCDFKDAVFVIDGKAITGDIEVHVKSNQWYSHGHHQNPNYNNTALHVVMWHNHRSSTVLQSGMTIPTICLSPFLTCSFAELLQQTILSRYPMPSCPEAKRYSTRESLAKLLDSAGQERFAIKSVSFRSALMKEEAGQVFYRNIARAFGYARNTKPFEILAEKLSLSTLERDRTGIDNTRQAKMLGTAGLLPSQRDESHSQLLEEPEIKKLEAMWLTDITTDTMKRTDWCFFRVRPDNFPTRRLVALSCLLAQYRQSGLLHGMLNLVREATGKTKHRQVENGLMLPVHGYWANHFDFGLASSRSSALLGQGKAGEVVVNILLPFTHAWGEMACDSELKDKASKIYSNYPKLPDNQLTYHMKQQLLLKPDTTLSTCQQQGLLHIFKSYCRYRNCAKCPVSLNRG